VKAAGVTIVVLVLLIAGGLGLRWILAEPSGAVQQREMTVGNGAYRISAYEEFYQECSSALTAQQNLANAISAAHAENVDPTRQAQLDANVTALTNVLNRAVNDYNAHARETDTRAHFLSSDLPFEIQVDPTDPTNPPIDCKVAN
jgi:hypothetical protein